MNLLPKLIKIEITRNYYIDIISLINSSYWSGIRYYNWLWFNWEKQMLNGKHFKVENSTIEFSKIYNQDVEIVIIY